MKIQIGIVALVCVASQVCDGVSDYTNLGKTKAQSIWPSSGGAGTANDGLKDRIVRELDEIYERQAVFALSPLCVWKVGVDDYGNPFWVRQYNHLPPACKVMMDLLRDDAKSNQDEMFERMKKELIPVIKDELEKLLPACKKCSGEVLFRRQCEGYQDGYDDTCSRCHHSILFHNR